jgi:hypothetical protein
MAAPKKPEKPAQPDSMREEIRFNWNEVTVDKKRFFIDPENPRRKIPCIIARFPQDLTVTIFGSHYRTKKDRAMTHLMHKSRDADLRPYMPHETEGYLYKSYSPLTPFPAPAWSSMIFFLGRWRVSYHRAQKLKGKFYKDALQRSHSGSWVELDPEIARAFDFAMLLMPPSMDLDQIEKYDLLHGGLWDGLLPALLNGKFSEVEAAFNLAREVKKKKFGAERFVLEEHFPYAVTPFAKGLKEASAQREKQGKFGPPSAMELMDYMNDHGLLKESVDPSGFRKALDKVGLGWLKESRKKS